MAYVEVRKGGKLITQRLVDDAEAAKGCRIRLGSAGKVRLKIGESKVVGKYEVSVHEGMPSDDAHKAVDGLSKDGNSLPEMSATETASMEDIPATRPRTSRSGHPVIEGYQIVGRLGEGGMGTVWRAVQLSTKREVALKFMGRHRFASDKARARFEREVSLAAKLTHPNIARVYHSGIHRGVYYYAMELVDGVHLDKYVQQNYPTQEEMLELMERVCDAIQHAHTKGIIHRDLKPSNILVTSDGQPHVVDFGLAKASEKSEGDMTISIDGELAGTLAYMAPEQAAGRMDQISVRTDVYSLGVILYRLLTGESPHALSGSRYDTIKNIVEEEIVPPRDLNPAINADLEWLVLTALEKEPENRYPSAGVLRQDIQNYLKGEPLLARSMSTTYLIRKSFHKRAKPIAKVAALLLVMVTAIVIGYCVGGAKRGPQHTDAGLGPLEDTQQPVERLSSSPSAIDAVDPASDQRSGVQTTTQTGPANRQMWRPTRGKPPSAILVDGKPFFVICARSAVPEELVEYKRAGFNTVSTHDCDDLALDEAHDNGLWAIARLPWYRLPGTWRHMKDNTMTDSDWLEFENQARRDSLSDALLAWALPTNPLMKGMQPDDVKRAYRIVKKHSPDKPGFLLFSAGALGKNPFGQYSPYCDVLAIEHYPKNNIKTVADNTDRAVSQANGKPTWVLVPAWGKMEAKNPDRFIPSGDQVRSMAYLAVNHGASGIFISGFKQRLWEEWEYPDAAGLNDSELSVPRRAALRVAGELRELSPAILAGPLLDAVSLIDGNGAIDMKAYATPSNDTLYIAAVNTSTQAVAQRFKIPTTMAAKIQVLGASRMLSHSNGEFTDVFASHETHVYVLQPQGSSSIGQPAGTARAIAPSSAVSETLPEGLVLYYSFDTRAVNNNITDLSGLDNHGTLEGAQWVPNGRIGGAYSFDAANKTDRIRVPDSDSLDCSYITIAAWIKTTDDDEYWNRILDKDWRDGYNLCLGGGSKGNEYRGKVVFEMHSQGVRSKNVVADGTWHHVAGTFDGQKMKLYVNGSLHSSKTCRIPIPANSWDIGIGNEHPLYDLDEFLAFDGLIDEIMLFNRALSQQEVTDLYTRAGAGTTAIAPVPDNAAEIVAEPGLDTHMQPQEAVVPSDTSVPGDMVLIPGGSFRMGDALSEGEAEELPLHRVTLDSFCMGKYEVTNAQYCDYLNSALSDGLIVVRNDIVYKAGPGRSYSYFSTHQADSDIQIDYSGGAFAVRRKGGRDMSSHPMIGINWYGAAAYCNWRSKKEGRQQCYNLSTWDCDFSKKGYRLPTEAEWEYAARGGLGGKRFPWGNTISHSQANFKSDGKQPYDLSKVNDFHPTWNNGRKPFTSPVGSFAANGYGLYDMAGNVWEWCHDRYASDYYANSPTSNPTGPATGANRVLRSADWNLNARLCRVTTRHDREPEARRLNHGLRVVLSIGPTSANVTRLTADETSRPAVSSPRVRKKILFFSQSMGYEHDVIKRPSNRELSYAEKVFERIARNQGYDVVLSKDAADLSTESKFDPFNAIVFYTSKSPPINKTAMLAWLRSGRALIGIHSACDSFYDWPEYGRILGGYFEKHSQGPQHRAAIKIEDAAHPATQMLPASWRIADEIYQIRDFSRDNCHVLLSIDTDRMADTALRNHGMLRGRDYPVAWTNTYGNGRIFYTGFGHLESVWDDTLFQQHLLGGIKWALGDSGGGLSTPAPRTSFVDPDVSSRLLEANIGLLKVVHFNERTDHVAEDVLKTFVAKGVNGVILDLRGSEGGVAYDIANVTELFVPNERILWFSTDRTGQTEQWSQRQAAIRTDLVVLVDGHAGSGCELLAAAIKRNRIGIMVGQRTSGNTADVDSAGRTKTWFQIEKDIQITGKGIEPDVQVPTDATEQQWLDAAILALRQGRAGSFLPGTPLSDSQSDWVNLFNGRDLRGWKRMGGAASFEVSNGAIVGATVKGSTNTFLCTETNYEDFELEFEVRIDRGLNSGVQIRSNSLPGYKNGQVHGYQVEIDAGRGDCGFIYDEGRRGWLSTNRSDQKAQRVFKATQWNKLRVLCKGDSIKTWVNDVPVADLKDSMTRKGFIALQVHRYDGPVPVHVYFRNIRIKEL